MESNNSNTSNHPVLDRTQLIEELLVDIDALMFQLVERDESAKLIKADDRINSALYAAHCISKKLQAQL